MILYCEFSMCFHRQNPNIILADQGVPYLNTCIMGKRSILEADRTIKYMYNVKKKNCYPKIYIVRTVCD